MKRIGLTVFILIGVSFCAAARNTDGTLGLIQTPNSGVPVIVAPGDQFDIVLTGRAPLSLTRADASITVRPAWTELPGGRMKATCSVPGDAPPGAYAVEAGEGDKKDRNMRAVYVRDGFPESYAVAHITDVHVGAERGGRTAEDIFRELVAVLNEKDLAFVLVTGDITHNGTGEELRVFVEVLDACTHPTFVCPGNHDRKGLNYEHTFGSLTYMFWFGQDGYLLYDTKDYLTADELGPQDADIQVYRRAIKPARWAIGAAHRHIGQANDDGQRHEPGQGIRSQITLFVDDPLDLLILGHWHRENRTEEQYVLWGTTPVIVTPAAIDGAYRLINMTRHRILPLPVETVE
jgi:hypothetical protein